MPGAIIGMPGMRSPIASIRVLFTELPLPAMTSGTGERGPVVR